MRYFSTKSGSLCTRYGTGTYIGASVSVVQGKVSIVYDESEIAAISDYELDRYRREYDGLVAEGSLVERKQSDFDAWQEKLAEDSQKAADDEAAQAVATQAPPEAGAAPTTES